MLTQRTQRAELTRWRRGFLLNTGQRRTRHGRDNGPPFPCSARPLHIHAPVGICARRPLTVGRMQHRDQLVSHSNQPGHPQCNAVSHAGVHSVVISQRRTTVLVHHQQLVPKGLCSTVQSDLINPRRTHAARHLRCDHGIQQRLSTNRLCQSAALPAICSSTRAYHCEPARPPAAHKRAVQQHPSYKATGPNRMPHMHATTSLTLARSTPSPPRLVATTTHVLRRHKTRSSCINGHGPLRPLDPLGSVIPESFRCMAGGRSCVRTDSISAGNAISKPQPAAPGNRGLHAMHPLPS